MKAKSFGEPRGLEFSSVPIEAQGCRGVAWGSFNRLVLYSFGMQGVYGNVRSAASLQNPRGKSMKSRWGVGGDRGPSYHWGNPEVLQAVIGITGLEVTLIM